MITTAAILHDDRPKLLGFSGLEKQLALQLGGDNPQALAECAHIAEDWGYDEVNLSVCCPSDRVKKTAPFPLCVIRMSIVSSRSFPTLLKLTAALPADGCRDDWTGTVLKIFA